MGHLFYATSSFVYHFIAIGEFKLELQSGNANLGQIRRFLKPCDLEIWRMTLKNNRAPLLSIIKPYAWFHHHMWIRKRLSWVVTSVTLAFDLWPFAWTSLLSLVIAPENFMMIWWWEHSQKGVTDRLTENTIHRAAWSQLKIIWHLFYATSSYVHHSVTIWIQTGVTVRKCLIKKNFFLSCATLTFGLWPWPFAWTPLLSMVITPENFMMIRCRNIEKGVTDRRMDRRTKGLTEPSVELLGRS